MSGVRLNKYLADCGVCARRTADDLIRAGHVSVDGRPAALGQTVDPAHERIAVRGKAVGRPSVDHLTVVLNKPRGVITTLRDERGRPTVARFLPTHRRLFPVGRLDADSTGVLLCTTDGTLAEALLHPSHGVEKRYRVRAEGRLTNESRAALQAAAVSVGRDGTVAFDMILREGKNRQVRRMCAQAGLRVVELQRVRFGPIGLRGLAEGKTRALTGDERLALERLKSAPSVARNATSSGRATVQPTE